MLSFSKFSDQEWSAVCARLPRNWQAYCHPETMRSLIEHAVSSFCRRRNFPPGTHAVTVDEKGDVIKYGLVEKHRLIASTANAFSEAYDPTLNVDVNLKPADNPGDHIKWVKRIARNHERAAKKLERESRSSAGRGRKSDKALEYLMPVHYRGAAQAIPDLTAGLVKSVMKLLAKQIIPTKHAVNRSATIHKLKRVRRPEDVKIFSLRICAVS